MSGTNFARFVTAMTHSDHQSDTPLAPRTLTPQATVDLMQADASAVLIDIRSSMEFLFVGHPKGAVHIAWIDEPDWTVNPDFVTDVRKLMLGGVIGDPHGGYLGAPVILLCRSGKRSKEAGMALLAAGFKAVYHVQGGFEGDLDENHHRSTLGGWRFHGLPWAQC